MIKAAVIGVGSLGQHHARVYSELEGVKLMGVADVDVKQATEVAHKVKCDHFDDPLDLIGLVDVVSIVVPTQYHFEVAKPFLEKGVHCLLEKPMTSTIDQADALIELAGKNNALLQVGHIERFNPAILAIHHLKSNPLFIEAHRMGPYSPRVKDTGVVLDLMIHDLDIVLDMVGRKVEKVDAVGVPLLSPTEDIANVRLSFEGGCVANLTASRVTTKRERKIRIFTRDTYLSVDYMKKEVKVYRLKEGADPSTVESLIGLSKMVEIETLKITEEEQLKLELQSFVDSVSKGEHPEVSGQQGREALALGLEVQKKLSEHLEKTLG